MFNKIIWVAISEFFGRGSVIIGNVYIARICGPENYGIFLLSQIIVQHIWIAMDAGISLYGIREIAQNKEGKIDLINVLLSIRLAFGIMAYTALIFVLTYFPIEQDLKNFLYISGLYLVIYSVYTDWVFKGKELFHFLVLGSFVIFFIFIFGLALFVNNKDDIEIAIGIWILSYALASIVMLLKLYKVDGYIFKPNFNFSLWKKHLKQSIYFSIISMLTIVYHSTPIFIIAVFMNNEDIGYFSAPFRLILSLGAAGFIIIGVFYPLFSRLVVCDKKDLENRKKQLLFFVITIGIGIGLFGSIFSQSIILALFGDEYLYSINIFKILIWLPLLYFIRNSYGSVIMAYGFQKYYNIVSLIGTTSNIALCVITIPIWGIWGATISTVFSEIILVLSAIFLYKKKVKIY